MYLLVGLVSVDDVVDREQDGADVLEPLRPDMHGSGETSIQACGNPRCTIVGRRILQDTQCLAPADVRW